MLAVVTTNQFRAFTRKDQVFLSKGTLVFVAKQEESWVKLIYGEMVWETYMGSYLKPMKEEQDWIDWRTHEARKDLDDI